MKVRISKSELKGELRVPSSKSQTIRGLVCAAMARGESQVVYPLVCEDTEAAARVLAEIGVNIARDGDVWHINGGSFRPPSKDLDCGESATTLRFMTAVCALVPGTSHLVGGPSLMRRPVRSLVEALQKLGVKCSMEGKTTPPVTVQGGIVKGGQTSVAGNISSQFISALLLVAPFGRKDVNIKLTTKITSAPYLLMTVRCMRKFGVGAQRQFDGYLVKRQPYKPAIFEVEGDWSAASYFLALGAFSEAGVTVENVSTSSLQGDRVILDLLRNMGVKVRISGKKVTVSKAGPDTDLKAIEAELTDCIDLLPTMAALAALADGTSVLSGISRARIKESNRVTAMREGLQKLGVTVVEDKDKLTITGLATKLPAKDDDDEEEEEGEEGAEKAAEEPAEPEIVEIKSYDDHRIAMAFGIIGAVNGGLAIAGAECVAKTYPEFWDVLKSIGGQVQQDG
jgi:3-phosphoshikimate 1-carboxyvinyltransferase